MLKIRTMNTISPLGTGLLAEHGCEVGPEVENPDALLIRSADLHDMDFGRDLLCIGRAGAGVNNIPIDRCTEEGIAVFNSPGANADATKEMVIFEMLLASRDMLGSIEWVKSIAGRGAEIPALVEKGKSAFAGPELCGKSLGVIGLGAVGALVANTALQLGMTVRGYDPYMSVDAAWRLSRHVIHVDYAEEIFRSSDYISLNVPYTESTHHMIDATALSYMKPGVRIMNESRAEVVDDDAMLEAIASGRVGKYVTDFPNEKLIGKKNVICTPHLGACTPESEEKCAVMAAQELYDYLVNGNIKNSVNLPNATLERLGKSRLCVIHRNVPNMINSILDLVSARNINVEHMLNKPRGAYAYTMMDLSEKVNGEITGQLSQQPNVLRVRVL
ncbi:MAG TPA: phosphoglycerate dehydrogenase [Candidatus Scatomorpha stercorigallinarum]|nr:phosphoglycerate dehydrogenase [Candidatus Scatomorpha stercorigallinarum]